MEDDPWANTPSTPRSGTPRVSLERAETSPAGPSQLAQSAPTPSSEERDVGDEQTSQPPSPGPVDEETPEEIEVKNSVEDKSPAASPFDADPELPSGMKGDSEEEGFDDFDDFDEAPEAGPSTSAPGNGNLAKGEDGDDDGFGDFGDFEEGDFDAPSAVPAPVEQAPTHKWRALNLRPFPTTSELLDQLSDILRPLVPPAENMSSEPVRSVGGLSQVMVAESSRDVYAQLTTAPMLKPLDWTRSRVRREHLISMGVPVNLDEVDSHRLSALPPLRITTEQGRHAQAQAQGLGPRRAQSMEVNGGRSARASGSHDRPASTTTMMPPPPRDKGKAKEAAGGAYGLGEKPPMDASRAEELCGIEEDRLSLLSLASLRKIQNDLVETSAQASASLAWSLQLKDAQTQDSATYNGMISELIANAAKAKSAQQAGSGGVFRKSSQKARQSSGASTPRVGSPAMR